MRKETVYVLVDDQSAFLKSFQLAARLMRLRDYHTFTTSDGLLEVLNGHPHLKALIVDWNLRGSKMQKAALVKELVRRKPSVPVYVISTSSHPNEMTEARKAGAAGWIVKTDLFSALKKWIREKDYVSDFMVWR